MVPRLLTPEQKEIRMNICADILQNIENNSNILENVITCDESWFFQYDPESKRQSTHWKSASSPRQKKARQRKWNLKQWWSFLRHPRDCSRGLGAWKSDRQPALLQGGFEKPWWKGEKKKTWNVEQRLTGSSPRQRPGTQRLDCQDILTKHKITVLKYPLCSPDLATCDFFYFQRSSLC